jgi:hypothetical protein
MDLRIALLLLTACAAAPDKAGAPEESAPIDADGDGVPAGEDCADGDADIRPGADERCNGLDDDCDGEVDEDAVDAELWYPDRDGDGFGSEADAALACQAPAGSIALGGDCDDQTATVHPERDEQCNGRDDDCDGETDEADALDQTTWYPDADGDGFGDPGQPTEACAAPADHVLDDSDCDDTRAEAFPGATEQCATGALEDCSLSAADAFALCGPGGQVTVGAARLVVDGTVAGERAGDRAAAAGDLDGDGVGDLLLGSTLADAGGPGAGAVWVVSGALSGVMELGTAAGTVVTGGAEDEGLGAAMLGAGDLDGDGVDDLLVGATGGDGGMVRAILGPMAGALDAPSAAWATWAAPAGAEAGAALVLGGFGAPGAAAIAVGAPGGAAGGVYIVPGPSAGGGALADQVHLAGERPGGQAGATLARAGDVDGDGIDDLLVGALTDDRGAANGGAAFLLLGPLTADASLEDAAAIVRGTRTGAALGGGVAGAGDLDGDGHADLVVGAYADGTTATSAGAAYVFVGPLSGTVGVGAARATVYGTHRGDGLGQEIVGGGDLDGDGVPDLVFGTPSADPSGPASGAVFALLGPLSGTRSAETAESILTGIGSGGRAGAAVALVPDLDGDGADELLIGAPAVSPGGRTSAGAGYLVAGGGR